MTVLFFMNMPDEFQYLSILTFTVQQLLVPRPWLSPCTTSIGVVGEVDVFRSISVNREVFDWTCHYNNKQKDRYHCPNDRRIGKSLHVSVSMHYVVPRSDNIGPKHVNHFFRPDDDGVWYPDDHGIRLVWCGGENDWDHHKSGREFNPFKISGEFTGEGMMQSYQCNIMFLLFTLLNSNHAHLFAASYLTERLGKQYTNLQWSLIMQDLDSYPPDHGNVPYASLDLRPKRILSKEGYLDFTGMRRFPLLALRKLCTSIMHGSLPLQLEPVQKLIRQTLYQVGKLCVTIDDANKPMVKMQWRSDIVEICKALSTILQEVAKIQKERPFLYKASAILGEMACYIISLNTCQFDCNILKECSRNLAEAAISWAKEYDHKM
eukprot:15332171-Ditylum_brightwellii.AAC.1